VGPVSKVKPPPRSRPRRPPGWSFFSNTSTAKPLARSRIAAASPPIPAPTTATRFVANKPASLKPNPHAPKGISKYTRGMLAGIVGPPGKGAHTKMTKTTTTHATRIAALTMKGAARARSVILGSLAPTSPEWRGSGWRGPHHSGPGRRFLGRASYDPKSEITLCILTREAEEINETFVRVEKACAYRRSSNTGPMLTASHTPRPMVYPALSPTGRPSPASQRPA